MSLLLLFCKFPWHVYESIRNETNGTTPFLFLPPFSPIFMADKSTWMAQPTDLAPPARASAFLVPPGSDASCFRSHSRSKEMEEDSEAEGGSWKAFSCVSDPRCERSSPAALSCSSRYRLGYVYDSSWSLETHNKPNMYTYVYHMYDTIYFQFR